MGQLNARQKQFHHQAAKLLDDAIIGDDADALYSLLLESAFRKHHINQSMLLHHASSLGHVACVQALLQYGADANGISSSGLTPLHCAVTSESNVTSCISHLIQHGALVNHMGGSHCRKTALHVAVEHGCIEAITKLLECGISVNVVSECDKGISPLLLAAQLDDCTVFQLLLESGADLRKCWIWKSTLMPPLDLITHRMMVSDEYNPARAAIFRLLLQADGNLTLTLCLMPQGQQTKVGALRTFFCLRTILERLKVHYGKQAHEFLAILILSGYKPKGESVAFLHNFDSSAFGLVKYFMATVATLKQLCVKVIRKRMQKNVLHGSRGLEKCPDNILDLITMAYIPQPDLIWL